MKGRRRARQLALQSLYELDQSDHALPEVIAYRLEAFYRGVARHREVDQSALFDALLEEIDLRDGPESPFEALDPAALSDALGREREAIDDLLEGLKEYQPQGAYGIRLIRGVLRNLETIDAVIARIAPEWPVEQMAPIDRNCLRIALWEIASESAPVRVVINEAVELARRYSGEGSRRMVNGALGAFTSSKIEMALDAATR